MDFRRLQVYFFMAILVGSLLLSFLVFRPYLGLIIFSGILAILAGPLHHLFLRFFRGQRSLSALATVIITLIVFLLPLAFVAASLVTEAVTVFRLVRTNVDFQDVEGTLSRIIDPASAHAVAEAIARAVTNVADYVQPFFASFTSNVFAIFSNAVAVVFGIFLTLIGMYYLLKDGPEFKRILLDLSPLSDRDDDAIYARIQDAIRGVAYGSFAVALIKGTTGGLLFAALGLQAPVFWGSMIALANFIPVVGTAVVTAPFAIYLFVTGHFWKGLALSVVSLLIIGLVDNFVGPQIIKSRTHVHPLLILLSLLGGLSFFGPLGAFFGPIVLTATLALLDIYKKEFRQELEKLR